MGTAPWDRAARMLGLAYRIEQAIVDGALRDSSHAAELLGITRARMSQIMALQNLAPDIQERILAGIVTIFERRLREAMQTASWKEQLAAGSQPNPEQRVQPTQRLRNATVEGS